MHRCYLECQRFLFFFHFMRCAVSLLHYWDIRLYASSFLKSLSASHKEWLRVSLQGYFDEISAMYFGFKIFLVFLRYFSFLFFFFFLSPSVWWYLLPIFPSIYEFPFLRAFFSWFCSSTHSVIHCGMERKFRILVWRANLIRHLISPNRDYLSNSRSLSGKYPWERYEPPYSPSSYG